MPEFRSELLAYMGGIVRGLDGFPHATGGMTDHIHILMGLKPTHRLADVMREIKANSSGWIKDQLSPKVFAWQEGYGAFTVSAPDLEKVKAYVLKQEEHHRHKSFQEEYVAMLKRGLIEFDDRFLW